MLPGVGPKLCNSSPDAARTLLLLLALLAAPTPANPADSDDSDPFATVHHEGLGRVLQVWPMHVSRCPGNEADLLVLGARHGPPNQRKIVTWMPCGSALRPGDPSIVQREMGAEVVLVDVARLGGRSGAQLVRVSAAGIRVEALEASADDPTLEFSVPAGLPLPPRPRKLARVEIVADWHSNGRPVALVPSLTGGWLVDLTSGETRLLPMPVFADYLTWEPFLPRTIWKWMIAETRWPSLARADDNGDGHLDLFTLSRWQIWIYHGGPDGLPAEPSRRLDFVPFDEEIERRHESTGFSYFARDLDGDTRADLLLSTAGGGLMNGRSTTRVHLNSGTGVSLSEQAVVRRETEGGFSGIQLVDLDGDGREEMIEMTLDFSVLKLVGLLLTGGSKIGLRVLSLDPSQPDGTRTSFEDRLSFRLDLASSRVKGLIPTLGDWNGDGIQDLFVAKGAEAIAFRLGERTGQGPRFDRARGRQPLPLESGECRVADLDGDGLDDLIAFDHWEPEAPLVVLHNRGQLPGSRPTLRAPDPD